MKIEYNRRVYISGKSVGCSKCALTEYTCLGRKGHCPLRLNEIFVYSNYSPLFEL